VPVSAPRFRDMRRPSLPGPAAADEFGAVMNTTDPQGQNEMAPSSDPNDHFWLWTTRVACLLSFIPFVFLATVSMGGGEASLLSWSG
jgi:hypothetical protein